MWKDFVEDVLAMVCLVVICVGTYYLAWGILTPDLYH